MATKLRELAEATPNSSHPNPLINHEKLLQLYATMLKCRLLGEHARIPGKQTDFENYRYSSVGLEATAVGAAIDLRSSDTLAPPDRDFILSYLKGVPLTAILSQHYGSNTALHKVRLAPDDCGYARWNIVLASNVATQLEMCIDIAFANQRKKNDTVVLAFCGEGSIPLNDWHDALRFAGQRSLPVIFVCQTHLSVAGSVPVDLASAGKDNSSDALGYGFPGITVDGNDAVAVYRVAQEAIERARSGGGPTLIEAQIYPRNGVDDWESSDPIAAMERYLTSKGHFSEDWKKEIIALFRQELKAAVDLCERNSCG